MGSGFYDAGSRVPWQGAQPDPASCLSLSPGVLNFTALFSTGLGGVRVCAMFDMLEGSVVLCLAPLIGLAALLVVRKVRSIFDLWQLFWFS